MFTCFPYKEIRVAFVWSTNYSLLLYHNRLESNLRFHVMWEGLTLLYRRAQKVSWQLSCENSMVVCLLINFLNLGKITTAIKKTAKYEVGAVLQLNNTQESAIHWEICTVYGQKVMSKWVVCDWVRSFKSGGSNMHEKYWPLMVNTFFIMHCSATCKWTNPIMYNSFAYL